MVCQHDRPSDSAARCSSSQAEARWVAQLTLSAPMPFHGSAACLRVPVPTEACCIFLTRSVGFPGPTLCRMGGEYDPWTDCGPY